MIEIGVSGAVITENSGGFGHAFGLDPEIAILSHGIPLLNFEAVYGGSFGRAAVTGPAGFRTLWFN